MEGGGEAAEERNEEGCDTTDTNAEERLLGTPPPPSSSSSSSPHAQEWRRKEEHGIKDASHTTDAVLDSLEVLRSQIIVGRQTRQDRRMHRISFTAEERCRLASASETLPPNGPMDSEGKHDMVIPPPPTAPSRSMPDAGQKARIPNPSEVDASNVRRFKLYVHALLESILCPSTECFSSSSSSSSTTTTTTTTTTNHAVQQKDPRDPFSRLTSEKKPQPPPREGEETKKNWDGRENPTGHVTRSREVEELWCYLQHIDTKLQANLLLDKQAWAAEGLSQDSNAPASPTEALLSSPKKKKERMDPDETSGTNGVFSDLARLFASVEAEHTMEHDKDDDDKEEEKKKKKTATVNGVAPEQAFSFRHWYRFSHIAAWVEAQLTGGWARKALPIPHTGKDTHQEKEGGETGALTRSPLPVVTLFIAHVLREARSTTTATGKESTSILRAWTDMEVLRWLVLLIPLAQHYFHALMLPVDTQDPNDGRQREGIEEGKEGARRGTGSPQTLSPTMHARPPARSLFLTLLAGSTSVHRRTETEENRGGNTAATSSEQRRTAIQGVLRLLLQYFDPELVFHLEGSHRIDVSTIVLPWLQHEWLCLPPSLTFLLDGAQKKKKNTTTTTTAKEAHCTDVSSSSSSSSCSCESGEVFATFSWWWCGVTEWLDFFFLFFSPWTHRYLLPYGVLSMLLSFRTALLPTHPSSSSSPMLPLTSSHFRWLPLSWVSYENTIGTAAERMESQQSDMGRITSLPSLSPSTITKPMDAEERGEGVTDAPQSGPAWPPMVPPAPWEAFFTSVWGLGSSPSPSEKPKAAASERKDEWRILENGLAGIGSVPLLPLPFRCPPFPPSSHPTRIASNAEEEEKKNHTNKTEEEEEEETGGTARCGEDAASLSDGPSSSLSCPSFAHAFSLMAYLLSSSSSSSSCGVSHPCVSRPPSPSLALRVWMKNAERLYAATPISTQSAMHFLFASSPSAEAIRDMRAILTGLPPGEKKVDENEENGNPNGGRSRRWETRGGNDSFQDDPCHEFCARYEDPSYRDHHRDLGFLSAYYTSSPVLPIEEMDVFCYSRGGEIPETTPSLSSSFSSLAVAQGTAPRNRPPPPPLPSSFSWTAEEVEKNSAAIASNVCTPASALPSRASRAFRFLDCRRRKSVEFARLPNAVFVGDLAAATAINEKAMTRLLATVAAYRGTYLTVFGTGRGQRHEPAISTPLHPSPSSPHAGAWSRAAIPIPTTSTFSSSSSSLPLHAMLEEDEDRLLTAISLSLVRREKLPLVGWCLRGMEGLRRLVYHRQIVLERGLVPLPALPSSPAAGGGGAPRQNVPSSAAPPPSSLYGWGTSISSAAVGLRAQAGSVGSTVAHFFSTTSASSSSSSTAAAKDDASSTSSSAAVGGRGGTAERPRGKTLATPLPLTRRKMVDIPSGTVKPTEKMPHPPEKDKDEEEKDRGTQTKVWKGKVISPSGVTTSTPAVHTAAAPAASAAPASPWMFLMGPEGMVPFFPSEEETKGTTTTRSSAAAIASPLMSSSIEAVSALTERLSTTAHDWREVSEKGVETMSTWGKEMLEKLKEVTTTTKEAAGEENHTNTSTTTTNNGGGGGAVAQEGGTHHVPTTTATTSLAPPVSATAASPAGSSSSSTSSPPPPPPSSSSWMAAAARMLQGNRSLPQEEEAKGSTTTTTPNPPPLPPHSVSSSATPSTGGEEDAVLALFSSGVEGEEVEEEAGGERGEGSSRGLYSSPPPPLSSASSASASSRMGVGTTPAQEDPLRSMRRPKQTPIPPQDASRARGGGKDGQEESTEKVANAPTAAKDDTGESGRTLGRHTKEMTTTIPISEGYHRGERPLDAQASDATHIDELFDEMFGE